MARLFSCGFEWKSNTNGVEAETFTGTTAINTTTKHSGSASLRCNPSAATGYVQHTFRADTAADVYIRAYVRIATLPAGDTTIMAYGDSSNFYGCKVKVTSGGGLKAQNSDGSLTTSGTATLSTNTWYRLECFYNETADTATVKIDGTTDINAATVDDVGGGGRVRVGAIDTSTMDIYIDDIAVNNTTGSYQTSYPGEGNIVVAVPTGAGDNAATTGIYSYINEIPPSNTATSGSTMIELDSNGVLGEYAMTDSSTLGIDSYDTITLVYIMARIREEAAGTSSYNLRLKSASGGTTSVSSNVDGGNATVRTNPSSTTAFGNSLVSYVDPTTSSAWTPTGTNSIDNMQAGVGSADSDSTPDLWCLTLCAMVEYVNGSPSGSVVKDIIMAGLIPFAR